MGQRMQWDTQTSSRNVGGQEGGKIILESRKIITKGAGAFRASSARTVIPPVSPPGDTAQPRNIYQARSYPS